MSQTSHHDESIATPGLLSRTECEQILRNIQKYWVTDEENLVWRLKDFTLVEAKNAVGYLGDYFHLTLNYAAEQAPQQSDLNNNSGGKQLQQPLKPLRLFVKTLSSKYAEPEIAFIFKKEVALYTTLLRELQSFSSILLGPHCYYTRDDILVLEDLSYTGEYGMTTRNPLSDAQIQQLLRCLATMHAASIAYEVRHNVNIGEKYESMLREVTVSPTVSWYTTGIAALLAVAKEHPHLQSAIMQTFIAEELPQRLERVYAMTGPSKKYCNVLCHRDCWSGNVFFARVEHRAALMVDFQTCRYCPPAIDVIMAIYMNSDAIERCEIEYLRFYYAHFGVNLEQLGLSASQYMTEDELRASYNEFRLFGQIYKALAATILMMPTAYVTNEYKYVNRTHRVLQHMRENEPFRVYMQQCIELIVHLALRL